MVKNCGFLVFFSIFRDRNYVYDSDYVYVPRQLKIKLKSKTLPKPIFLKSLNVNDQFQYYSD